jgi:hypothetical protein
MKMTGLLQATSRADHIRTRDSRGKPVLSLNRMVAGALPPTAVIDASVIVPANAAGPGIMSAGYEVRAADHGTGNAADHGSGRAGNHGARTCADRNAFNRTRLRGKRSGRKQQDNHRSFQGSAHDMPPVLEMSDSKRTEPQDVPDLESVRVFIGYLWRDGKRSSRLVRCCGVVIHAAGVQRDG